MHVSTVVPTILTPTFYMYMYACVSYICMYMCAYVCMVCMYICKCVRFVYIYVYKCMCVYMLCYVMYKTSVFRDVNK